MCGVEADWQEQGHDFAPEIISDPAPLLGRALYMRNDADILSVHGRMQLVAQNIVLPCDQGMGLFADFEETFLVELSFLYMRLCSMEQIGHAYLEIFVEIGRNDGQIAQPLQQRHLLAGGPVQYTGIECQNAQVAVDQGRLDGHVVWPCRKWIKLTC